MKTTAVLLFAIFGLMGNEGCKDAPTTTKQLPVSQTPIAPPPCVNDTEEIELLPEEAPPPRATAEFTTDFTRHVVPYADIFSGGPSKDGIPAIDNPRFATPAEADSWLKPNEPVVFVQIGDDARAYPIQILMWHEITNDIVGGIPLVVTFCPLCNTAIAFERAIDGLTLDFGTTGRLRFSNLIMYDRQTETWWQQALGNAIAGDYTGRCLNPVPASIIAWQDFKDAHPTGRVLSRETGHIRNYGQNPYVGYDDINATPFLYRGPTIDGQLPPMARVLAVDLNGEGVAYPYQTLEEIHVANDNVGGVELTVFWTSGTASGLDERVIPDGQDVGAAAAYRRNLDGQLFEFTMRDDKIKDVQTESTWNIFGEAIEGPMIGQKLESVPGFNHFWFSWSVFRPDTRVFTP